jgi:hypothetical protein
VGGQVELEQAEARRSDDAGPDRAGQVRLPGSETPFGAEEVHHAGALGRVEHRRALVRVTGERLLAHHVFARADGFERDRGMGVWWCRDGDGVHARRVERLGEYGGRNRHTELRRPILRLGGVSSDQRDDLDAGGLHRPQMGEHTEAGSHDHRANSLVAHGASRSGRFNVVLPRARRRERPIRR